MQLNKILKNINYEIKAGNIKKEISEIKYDSRAIKTGNLFIAISGFKIDGHQYISQAIENGATAIIIEKELEVYEKDITYLKVENSRQVMSILAKNFFDNPLKEIKLIGITGTNGKTTTAYLLYKILQKYAGQAALFGTISNIIGSETLSSNRTTPESLDLYRYFAQMKKKGIKYGVMEVSSHALDLYRVESIDFEAAIFTNLSPEHLDYHQSLDNYREVKSRLFSQLKPNKYAIINADDPNSEYIKKKSEAQNLSYSLDTKSADLYTTEFKLKQTGLEYKTGGKLVANFKLNLGGLFNIYNSLAVVLTALVLGIEKNIIKKALADFDSVPGRFEIIDQGQKFQLIVDYAHTPDAMENILKAALNIKKNKLIILFGCGGDRDRSKRPLMAALAEKYADSIIISNDNPRSESPTKIFKEIEKGFSSNFTNYSIIPDRKKGIKAAIELAKKDDLVLLLGRGHEKYQVIKERKIELDDRQVAIQALKDRE
ncbi:UDP-N-acetylmuramoyl-L-alanyl-D-glutamate--2,6-diaminopimelate ligase [Halanaerobium praevalens]|uniref:UDP-N-acetylmuramoyl-L-alanyl-D-glutamate--2,6-diaminopimelate ligase n=1 Tax=Halanaerobium praevalens (strain ATCC 33744 / DSM 2228 / GSL) TaxID=572479 RepID=E3DQH2_HALPG|nr:UDP-N-acetylmuramoyl-L-alanyl-D-glutamate--2,6-diaminopimelate ligase [Halanaerobium praevalens]ADO76868.1 UDP-N-acetylmuramoylalanyl-D-glutamate--2,6-diaminopimelate ligase [Halanaerobium praevalens DSM 2228]